MTDVGSSVSHTASVSKTIYLGTVYGDEGVIFGRYNRFELVSNEFIDENGRCHFCHAGTQ